MKSQWVIVAILGLLLTQTGSASVTDPNMIIEVVRSGSTQTIAPAVVNGGLQQGALIFADRTTTYWGNVGRFAGLDYVKMTMEDRTDADVQFAVAIRKAGTIFLVVDNRVGDDNASNPPTLTSVMTWVPAMGFTPTSYSIGFSEQATVYKLNVTGDPNVITFYEQNNGTSRAMYSIIMAPAGWNFPPVITGVPASAQVPPAPDPSELVVNATISDDDGPSAVTVQWTTVSAPAGATVTYAPNNTSEDVTISFSKMGAYTLKIAAFDGEKTTEQTVQVSVQIPTFALQAADHCEIGNDSNQGPAATRKSTISDVKNFNDGSAQRRRVCYYKYDISALQAQREEGKVFSNSFFSVQIDKGNDYATKNTYVYAINEELDGFTFPVSWNTAPGVDNTPVPALNSPITIDTLDPADISGLLAAFPVPTLDVWLSTGVFPALDAALNADTDGIIVLMFITYDPETVGYEYLSPSHSRAAEPETGLKGIILRGQIWYPTYATNPNPAVNASANPSTLTQLSWTNPAPSEPGATVTSNVYFGTTEPNMTDPDYGLDTIATGTANEYVMLPYALTRNVTYYWVVDTVDSASGLVRGFAWSFNTNNNAPVVDAGANQYVWLNNAGNPASATASLNGTVTDDGFPGPYTVKWEQIGGPATVVTEPNDVEDITVVLTATGAYTFKLTANDGDLSSSDSMEVFVGATPCDAAKAKPTYVQMDADFNNDCYVDIADLGEFASAWLECNASMDAPCN
jgi:hypothetical protein